MKKLLLLFITTAISQITYSQEIVLRFEPADGTSVIDSVKTSDPATNQVSVSEGAEITLPDETTSLSILQKELPDGSIYPNPFEDRTEVQFATSMDEKVIVSVANAAGQVVSRQQKRLQPGMHRFQLSVKSQGMYFITIAGRAKTTSFKAVSLRSGGNEDRLLWLGSSPVEVTEKSAKAKEGKLYHFEIYSGENVTVIADRPTASKTYEVEFHECKDADGKNYKIVQIGEQWWMAENLAYLPAVSPAPTGSDTYKHYYVYGYNGEDVNAAKAKGNFETYGVLYNLTAALESCPGGWHLPSDLEWTQLEDYLIANGYNYDGTTTGNKIAKSLAATTYWKPDSNRGTVGNNLSANNFSGFSALPAGLRHYDGSFSSIGSDSGWWSSTNGMYMGPNAYYRLLYYSGVHVVRNNYESAIGSSVRCVKD